MEYENTFKCLSAVVLCLHPSHKLGQCCNGVIKTTNMTDIP